MKRVFVVTGYKGDEKINSFLKACDLGIDGAIAPFSHTVSMKQDDDAIVAAEAIITEAYERAGAIRVRVQEITVTTDA